MKIEWKSEYNIGIDLVDEQHEWLVRLYNNIAKAHAGNHTIEILARYMKSLVHYTQFHFSAEERELEKLKYAELDFHKKQHEQFVRKINEYMHAIGHGKHEVVPTVLDFLRNWLLDHILYEDKKYVELWNSLEAMPA